MYSWLLVLGRASCFKKPVRRLRSVCGERPRLRAVPKLLSTRKTKPNIYGLPTLANFGPRL